MRAWSQQKQWLEGHQKQYQLQHLEQRPSVEGRGLRAGPETAEEVAPKILELDQWEGHHVVIE
jgi:hypothetical protein